MKSGSKFVVIVIVLAAAAAAGIYLYNAGKQAPVVAQKAAVEPNVVKPAASEANEPNKSPAVTVNGTVITEGEVDAKIDAFMQRAAGQIPPGMVEQYKMQMRPQVVESMVMEKILDDQIKKAGVVVTDKDVDNKLNEIIAEEPGMTLESFKTMLAAQGQPFDQVKEQIKKRISYEKLIGNVDINDADAMAYYEANKDTPEINKPEEIKASHILVKVDASATPEQKASAKAKIEKLLQEVNDGGDFATIAKENSDCPSKVRGGDLGYFDRNTMVKEFADAAFAMKVGQVSGVVETQFGYHIIKVTDHKEGGQEPFEKAKEDIVKKLTDKKKGEIFRQMIQKFKDEAKIEYPPGKEPKTRMPMMPKQAAPAPQPAE